eukprot:GHVL01038424.1.p2 GENE.GHVL01038424.1~~GHVL01038424.1.p2  ORF type:complete len:106 (-),score=11.61 GHVL01038424.1:805-1122(-)
MIGELKSNALPLGGGGGITLAFFLSSLFTRLCSLNLDCVAPHLCWSHLGCCPLFPWLTTSPLPNWFSHHPTEVVSPSSPSLALLNCRIPFCQAFNFLLLRHTQRQ